MSTNTPYSFATANVKAYIRSDENQQQVNSAGVRAMSVFDAAPVLAVAFMKDQAEVLSDLIN